MHGKKFDPRKLQKLNNPQRLLDIPPEFIWDKLDVTARDVFVEIGAGTAFFCIAFLERYKPSRIYACDVSEEMIAWVSENVSPNHPGIIPVKTEESSVPLDSGVADLVFMINLHHELDDASLTVGEAKRLLKPEGTIFVVDWKKEEMPEGPPAAIRCTPEQVADDLVRAGFTSVRTSTELPKHFLVVGKNSKTNGRRSGS
jgi:SAM-dependent methyltransferase